MIGSGAVTVGRRLCRTEENDLERYTSEVGEWCRLFDTYWELSDSIDKMREEVWDADDSFHRDVNRIANGLEIIRLEEIRVPDTIGYYPSGEKMKQLGIKAIPSDREAGADSRRDNRGTGKRNPRLAGCEGRSPDSGDG